MSAEISDVIVVCDHDEQDALYIEEGPMSFGEPGPGLRALFAYFEDLGWSASIPREDLARRAGGPGWMRSLVYAWRVRGLDPDAFLVAVNAMPWRKPALVQALIRPAGTRKCYAVMFGDITTVPVLELERLEKVEALVRSALSQTGDDVCWRDLYNAEVAKLVGIDDFDPKLLPAKQFAKYCDHFHACLAGGVGYATPPADDIVHASGHTFSGLVAALREMIEACRCGGTGRGERRGRPCELCEDARRIVADVDRAAPTRKGPTDA